MRQHLPGSDNLLSLSAQLFCSLVLHSHFSQLYRNKMVSGRDNSGEILLHRINPLIHFHPFHPMHCYQLSLISPNAIIFIHFLQPYPFSSMYNVHCTSISPTFHFFNQFVHRTPLLPFQPPSSMLIHDHSFHPPSSSITSSTTTTMISISVQLLDHPLVYIVISSSWSSHLHNNYKPFGWITDHHLPQ